MEDQTTSLIMLNFLYTSNLSLYMQGSSQLHNFYLSIQAPVTFVLYNDSLKLDYENCEAGWVLTTMKQVIVNKLTYDKGKCSLGSTTVVFDAELYAISKELAYISKKIWREWRSNGADNQSTLLTLSLNNLNDHEYRCNTLQQITEREANHLHTNGTYTLAYCWNPSNEQEDSKTKAGDTISVSGTWCPLVRATNTYLWA